MEVVKDMWVACSQSVTQALCSGLFLSKGNSNMFISQEKWPIERERVKI